MCEFPCSRCQVNKVPTYRGHLCETCCKADTKVVALITVPVARNFQRCEESAAAYYVVRVEPGVYPVELWRAQRGELHLSARFSGVVVSSGYGAKHYHDDIGKPGEVSYTPYKYQLRAGEFWGAVEIVDAEGVERAQGI